MTTEWNEARLQQYIDDGIEEGLLLDYKAAASLVRDEKQKREVTKDVSSFANSAGGVIIYGIREFQDKSKRHLPEKLDPVDRVHFSKESLEQVINNIRPRIEGILIHSVSLQSAPNHVAFVVEIPQSTTAHQALDKVYYRRFNFASIPMDDHEVRDVMGRGQYPNIQLNFRVRIRRVALFQYIRLEIEAYNQGTTYARFTNSIVYLPPSLAIHRPSEFIGQTETVNGQTYYRLQKANIRRDVIEGDDGGREKLGTSWFDPILPSRTHRWIWDLPSDFNQKNLQGEEIIRWEVYADNAPRKQGEVLLKNVELVFDSVPLREIVRHEFPYRRIIVVVIVVFLALLALPLIVSRILWIISFLSPYITNLIAP